MDKMKPVSFDEVGRKRYVSDFFEKFFNLNKNELTAKGQALKITFIYILIGSLWILFSDKIIAASLSEGALASGISIIKGVLFVIISSVINFGLVNNVLNKLIDTKNRIEAINTEVEKANVLLSAVIESSPEVIVFSLDTNYCYTTFNNMHKEIVSYIWGKEIEKGANMLDVISNDEDRRKAKENFDRALNGESFTLVEEYGGNEISRIYWQNNYSPIMSKDGSIIGLTCFVLDITALKKAEEENRSLSYHDDLTGLYNRRFYEQKLKQIDNESNYPISIIVADVNGLKLTNDVFGHIYGDKLIKAFAEILKKECREEDFVVRIGGDEFVILLSKTDPIQSKKIIKKIQKAISNEKLEKSILSVSFGCAIKYTADESFEQLFKEADDSMYNQKLLDRNIFEKNVSKQLELTFYDNNLVEQSHSKEVSILCKKLGIELGLSPREINQLELAGLLHDIGKAVVNKEILLKPDKLSEYEWIDLKRHCEVGYKILSYLNRYRNIAEYVLYHHERMDGKGYPKGLKGAEIPLLSKVISIADAYNSMTSFNVYRDKMSVEDAVKELKKNAGTQFDATIAKAFVEKVLGEKWD